MPSIDERVVAMAFENARFEAGIATSLRSLTKLDVALQQIGSKNSLQDIEKAANKVTLEQPMSALDKLKARFSNAGQGASEGFNEIEKSANKVTLEQPMSALDKLRARLGDAGQGASDGFNEIEKASGRVSLHGLTSALDSVTAKFSVLSGAAVVALGNIASQGAQKGAAFVKGFSFGPIQQGLEEYSTNLNSIQTILANTQGQRVSGLDEVNKHLQELNTYSDKTIYNFSQMAKNIGTFTAAGVDLDKSTQSIKGIANLAALSGSNSQQASTAMYQLSQAIAAGRVGLQDWNSVVNAGMGGAVFQKSLMRTAENMGSIEKGALKIDKATGKATINGESFRNSIMAAPGKESWLTSDVLTTTLQQFTGDMTDAQLAAQGFNAEQIKAIQTQAKTAQQAATEVKTLPQVFDVAKEAIGSGWANTFKLIFGDFHEAKKTFTDLSNFINGFISDSAKARNKMLGDWKKLGGRDILIKGLKQVFEDLGRILKPIHDAFRDIFPAKTGKDLFNMTKGFADLMKRLEPSQAVIEGIHRTFRGLFAALSIGWYVVKKIIGVIGDLLGFAGHGAGGFLAFTGGIGDFVVALQKAIVKGDALGGVFQGITNVLRVPLEIVKALASALFGLFDGVDSGKAAAAGDAIAGVGDKIKPLEGFIQRLKETAKRAITFVNKLFEPFSNFVSGIGKMFANIGQTIADAFKGADTDQIIKVIQTGLLGGIFVALKKGISGGDFFVNPLKQISSVLDTMTGSLKSMQQAVKAGTMLAIAASIIALAGGVKILSSIDPKRLVSSMEGVAVGVGMLVAAMSMLQSTVREAAAFPLIAAGLIGIATAITILAGAVKIFSTMSWDEIGRGLGGVAGALAAIGIGVSRINGPQLTVMAPGLVAVALALNVMAVAMKIFGGMQWDQIGKGIVGIGAGLAAMSAGMQGIERSIIVVGPGLIAMGLGLTMLAGAVSAFGSQNILKMGQGIAGIAAALLVLSEAMWRLPPGPMLAGQAAGLVILAVALTGIAGAIKVMGGMDIATLVKGLITLGAALFELSIGLDLMATTGPGALALLGAAAAFAVLGPAIAFMGVLKWETILKGLAGMAGALLVMATAGSVAAPALAAMGVALTFLGVAVVTIGAGVYLIAKALIMLGDASVKSTGILIAAVTAFIAAIPKMVIDFLKGLVTIIAEVAKLAPKIVDSLTTILNSIIQVVINSTPKLAQAIGVLVEQILKVIVRDSPKLIQAGFTLILNLLRGLDNNISQVISRAASIVVKFLNGLAAKAPALTAAGARFLVSFLNGIASHLGEVVAAGVRIVVSLLKGVATGLPKIVGEATIAIVKFLGAIGKKIPDVVKAAVILAGRFVHAVARGLVKLASEGADAIIDFMHGIARVIRQKGPELMAAGADIAAAIVEGFIGGLADMQGVLSDALNEAIFNNEGPGSDAWNAEVKNLQNLKGKGHSRRDIEKMRLGYTSGELDQVFGPRRKAAATAKSRGKETVHKFAEGVKDGAPEIKTEADKSLIPLKKPVVMGPADPKPMLKQAAADLNPEAPAVKEVVKKVDPLGIKIGDRMVNGLKMGLRGIIPLMQSDVIRPIGMMLRQTNSLREFGKFLGGEFRQGLTGGLWDDGKSEAQHQIEGSFKALRAKLGEENGKLRDQLKGDEDKLKQLMGERDKNWGKIGALQKRVAQERMVLAQSRNATDDLMRGMRVEQLVLTKLAAGYEAVTKKLDAAKAKLNQRKDDRKQAIQQYTDQFGALPDLGSLIDDAANEAAMTWAERWDALRKKQKDDQVRSQIDQVAVYKKSLQDQIAATAKYMETLGQLRKLNLDDATYKKLLDMGTAGQEFASQLLRGGPGAITQINALDAQLKTAAGDLGKSAGHALYDAGIETAQGIVDGLKANQAKIKEAMISIAKSMVGALKLALGIKSPSRVFAELGSFSVQGFAEGLTASSNLVQDAAGGIGDDAADALSNSLAKISERVQNDIDTDVTITPVLDLSQVQRDASKIQDLTNVVPITAAASYGQAAVISQETQATATAAAEAGDRKVVDFKFEQNNTSPKALDDVEIYRQTKNGLSQVKSALGLPT